MEPCKYFFHLYFIIFNHLKFIFSHTFRTQWMANPWSVSDGILCSKLTKQNGDQFRVERSIDRFWCHIKQIMNVYECNGNYNIFMKWKVKWSNQSRRRNPLMKIFSPMHEWKHSLHVFVLYDIKVHDAGLPFWFVSSLNKIHRSHCSGTFMYSPFNACDNQWTLYIWKANSSSKSVTQNGGIWRRFWASFSVP